MNRQPSTDVVRASDPVEEVTVQTSDISSKFKFFETYKAPEVKRKTFRITPPRDGQQPKVSREHIFSKICVHSPLISCNILIPHKIRRCSG